MRWNVVVLIGLATGTARADVITGEVMSTTSRWTADGSRIVTEAIVRTPTGDVAVSQMGGSVGGFGMRSFPSEEPLVAGLQVSIDTSEKRDLRQRAHVVVDRVRVMARPPGFVRTGPTKSGKSLFWESGCVFVTADAAGTNQVNADNEFAAIDAAIAEWNDQTASCSYMNIVQLAPVASEVGRDNRNLIKFRDVTWCRPAVDDDPPRCHSENAAGITTAVFVDDASSSRDGAIVDADVELNGANFALAVDGQTTGTNTCKSEIANTLTHELGHLLGLEHPCLAAGDPQRIDGNGDPVPNCSSTNDPLITEATMYNFQDCGETKKASLEADDIGAICTVYPKAADPNVCAPLGAKDGCCNSSAAPHPSTLLLALGLLLLVSRKNSHRA
jgi:Pregnancy-associated plasma protein-A